MTREQLLKLITAYHCIDVPLSICDTLTCEECAEKVLTEYENEIYNKALDECKQILLEAMARDGKTKCHEYMVAVNEMEQLKKGSEQ